MHDIVDLESRGVPGVCVASREFEVAAASQSKALGLAVATVLVDHPIQDRTDEEMQALADKALGSLIAALTKAAGVE